MKAFQYLLTFVVIAGVLLWLRPHFELEQPFIAYAVGGAFLLFLASKPQKLELMAVAVVGLAFAITMTHRALLPRMLSSIAAGFGMASVASMATSALWVFPRTRQKTMLGLAPTATMIFFVGSSVHSLLAGFFREHTFDLYAYVFDSSFGSEISFRAGQLIHGKPWPTFAVVITYESVVVAIAAFYAAFMNRRERPIWELVELLFGASFLGYVFYTFFPATGPGYVFPGFPLDALPLDQIQHLKPVSIPITMHFPRNAVPSLHLTWTLLIWWNCRSLAKWAQVAAGLFVLGTAFSAMAIGEHYLFDLIVALPFALLVQSIMIRTVKITDRSRWLPAIFGFVIFALWLMIGRFGLPILFVSKWLPWALTIVSSIACVVWAFRLPALIPEMQEGR